MTEHNVVFVDRRTAEETTAGLATPILFWYDKDKKGRIRTNCTAVTTDGFLMVARSTCSKKDQFVKAQGRLVASRRLLGNAQTHCWKIKIFGTLSRVLSHDQLPEMAARAYEGQFPGDQMGHKRAYNAGNVFKRYRQHLDILASDILNDEEDFQN